MNKSYYCESCKKEYQSYMGLWRHNKKYHGESDVDKHKLFCCKYCHKNLSCKQSKWRHEQKCKLVNNIPLEEQVKKLTEEIKEIKSKPNIITNNNTTNNNTTNIQYIINSPTSGSINHLSFELQKDILDKGLNSLIYFIELVNFNKSVPENHSYCVTAINDKHASVIDEKTNTVVKTNKFDLFDKVLVANLDNLEKITNNPKFTSKQRQEYKDKINYLKTSIFENNNFMKRYQNDINLISYNNKELIKETWKNLKSIDDEEAEYYGDKPKGFDDLIEKIPENEKPDFLKKQVKQKSDIDNTNQVNVKPKRKPLLEINSESSEESESDTEECETPEIKIKGKTYILEGVNVYVKTKKGTKGELYGTYSSKTGKVKKVSPKEIEV